jgi:hypothetical protein
MRSKKASNDKEVLRPQMELRIGKGQIRRGSLRLNVEC